MNFNKDKYLQHIEEDKKLIMSQLLDKILLVEKNFTIETTDFLDLYEVYLATSILNRFSEVSYKIYGGYDNCERSVIAIYPDYIYDIDNKVTIFKTRLKYTEIKHKDILGSIMSLGIDRKKIGDIIINDTFCYFIIKNEVADYVEFNLNKIGRNNIKLTKVDEISYIKENFILKEYIISSLRLDSFLSSILGISRTKTASLIESDKVKVNFKIINKLAFQLKEKDIISVRKYGRFIFNEIKGKTKKDNYIVKIKIPN